MADGKTRCEYLDANLKVIDTRVWDGEMLRGFDRVRGEAVIDRRDGFPAVEDWIDYRTLYAKALHARLVGLFRARPTTRVTRDSGNRPQLRCEPYLKNDIDLANWGYTVTLDPEHGMLPCRIEAARTLPGNLQGPAFLDHVITIDAYHRTSDGTWVPVKAATSSYFVEPAQLAGQRATELITTVDVKKSKWNIDIPAREFRLPLPQGIRVFDRIRGIQYTTGQTEPSANLKTLAHATQVALLPLRETRPQAGWGGCQACR
jgi:hypothetical protein